MSKINLNLNDYTIYDLVKIFNIKINYDAKDLKKALKVVHMSHPDKSKRDKKYFIFLSNAYKLLAETYKYLRKKNESTEYSIKEKSEENIKKFIKSNNFGKNFNKMFEKLNIPKSTKGYGEWFRDKNTGIHKYKAKNASDMNMRIDELKSQKRKDVLSKYKGISEYYQGSNMGCSELVKDNSVESNYDSRIHASLQYQDLKKAYTETVVPVTNEDYKNKKRFVSINEMNIHRTSEINGYNIERSEEIYKKELVEKERRNIAKSYNMVKQMEETNRINDKWNANFKLLINK